MSLRAIKREPLYSRLLRRLDLVEGRRMVGKTLSVVLSGREWASEHHEALVEQMPETDAAEQQANPKPVTDAIEAEQGIASAPQPSRARESSSSPAANSTCWAGRCAFSGSLCSAGHSSC